MKLFHVMSLLVSAAAISTMACSDGGGYSRLRGSQCPNWDKTKGPINFDALPGQEKLSLKPENGTIPAGEYIYQRATLFYIDDSGFRIQIRDTDHGKENFKGTQNCVRNALNAKSTTTFTASAIYKMSVTDTDRTAQQRNYRFFIDGEGRYQFEFVTDPANQDPPTKVHPVEADYAFIKLDANNFLIRQTGIAPEGQFWMEAVYTRVDPAPPPVPVEPVPVDPGQDPENSDQPENPEQP
jgi:hypothetical protein